MYRTQIITHQQWYIWNIHFVPVLTREKLACMALFCGSDYTEGIEGAGPVTAIEAIAEFSGTDGLVNLK